MNTHQRPIIIAQVTTTDLYQDGTTEADSFTVGSPTVASIGGYTVPVNPMDDLECDSCQWQPRPPHGGARRPARGERPTLGTPGPVHAQVWRVSRGGAG